MSTTSEPVSPASSDESARPREEKITLRLSEAEKAQITARANARGLSASTYLRALGLGLLEG